MSQQSSRKEMQGVGAILIPGFNFKPQDLRPWFLYLCWAYPWPYGDSLRGNGSKKLFSDSQMRSHFLVPDSVPQGLTQGSGGYFFFEIWISQNFQSLDHWTFLPLILPIQVPLRPNLTGLCRTFAASVGTHNSSLCGESWVNHCLCILKEGFWICPQAPTENMPVSLSALPVPFHSIRCSQSSLKWGQRAPSAKSS